jgi:hypothetical protein
MWRIPIRFVDDLERGTGGIADGGGQGRNFAAEEAGRRIGELSNSLMVAAVSAWLAFFINASRSCPAGNRCAASRAAIAA